MSVYSTDVPANSLDQAVFINPFTKSAFERGRLNVRVDRDEIIGARAQAIVSRQTSLIPPTTKQPFPAILDPTHIAIGPFISGLGDNLFFDAVLGVGTNSVFGYNHPKIFPQLQRLGASLAGYIGAGTDFFYDSRHAAPAAQDLAELMVEFARAAYGGEFMMNFANAGTEANENALKIAQYNKHRQVKRLLSPELFDQMCAQLGITRLRPESDVLLSNYPYFIMAFHGAFHGRTATSNTISMSKLRQREGYQAIPYVVHAVYGPDVDFDRLVDWTPLDVLIKEKRLTTTIASGRAPADLLAALIIEPVQGEGGYLIPDPAFLQKLSAFVERGRTRGMCLVSDEVQTGLFRTGEFTAMQHWYKRHPALRPDLLTFAKPLHVGGVLADKRLLVSWPAGKFSGTWAEGNLLGIATACFTLKELKNIDPALGCSYAENARKSGDNLRQSLSQLAERLEKSMIGTGLLSNVRGLGQMTAFDVSDHALQERIVYQAFLHGLHLLGTGERSIRIFGTVDQRPREAAILLHVLEDAITAAAKEQTLSEHYWPSSPALNRVP